MKSWGSVTGHCKRWLSKPDEIQTVLSIEIDRDHTAGALGPRIFQMLVPSNLEWLHVCKDLVVDPSKVSGSIIQRN